MVHMHKPGLMNAWIEAEHVQQNEKYGGCQLVHMHKSKADKYLGENLCRPSNLYSCKQRG